MFDAKTKTTIENTVILQYALAKTPYTEDIHNFTMAVLARNGKS